MATAGAPGNITIYVSQMLPDMGGPSPALNSAWGDYVKSTYQVQTLSATCNRMSGDPAIQQRVVAAEQNAWQKRNMQVVQVNWQPGQKQNAAPNPNPYAAAGGGGKDAPPAGNQNAPAQDQGNQGPPPRASYCFSDQKKPTVYFSDAFDTADIQNPDDWVNAFIRMLVDKYKYKGSVTCNDYDTIFNAQEAIRDLKDTFNGKELIDTDWSYDPSQAPPPSNTPTPAPPPKKKSAAKPAPQN